MADEKGPSNGDWAQHKREVLGAIETYGEDIKEIRGDIIIIKLGMVPIPKMAESVEKLLFNQAKAEGAAEATNTGVHTLPQAPSTFKKVVSSDWLKTFIMLLLAGAFSIGGFKCISPGGYSCEANDISREAAKTTP